MAEKNVTELRRAAAMDRVRQDAGRDDYGEPVRREGVGTLARRVVAVVNFVLTLIWTVCLMVGGGFIIVGAWNEALLSDAAYRAAHHGVAPDRTSTLIGFALGLFMLLGGLGWLEEAWKSLRISLRPSS